MLIRYANPDESRFLQDLNHELFLSDQKNVGDLNTQWPYEYQGRAYFERYVDGLYGACFVAEIDGKIVGYVVGVEQDHNNVYVGRRFELENMCVTKEYRGRGVGSALVERFKAWCKAVGADYVTVSAFALNSGAVKFYEKHGFATYSVELKAKV